MERHESVRILHHKSFGNGVCVGFVRFGLADVILTHDGCFDGVQHTRCNYRQQGIFQGCRRNAPSIQDR